MVVHTKICTNENYPLHVVHNYVCPVQCDILLQSVYEPGKRHWLKVKKDYLEGGAMADTADLIVLGAYYGTGNKGTVTVSVLVYAWHIKN